MNPNDVKGVLKIHQSNPTGVCKICIQGLKNEAVSPGVVKQMSLKYPNLTIEITSEGVTAKTVRVRNGKYID